MYHQIVSLYRELLAHLFKKKSLKRIPNNLSSHRTKKTEAKMLYFEKTTPISEIVHDVHNGFAFS